VKVPDYPDVLAIATRVIGCDSRTVVDLTDIDRLASVLRATREAADSGDVLNAAAMLLCGLVRERPFHHANRRIAVAATLHLLALNELDLELEVIHDPNKLLDDLASGATSVSYLTRQLRALARPLPSEHQKPEGNMFERFTDRARRVVVLAQEEARLLNHNYIGTEHLLLGLVHEGEGVAAKALRNLEVSLEEVRSSVEEIIGQGQQAPSGHIPFTPRAKKVLELSLREAMQLGHDYIGTEHILLGLVREGEGVAAQVLVKLGADLGRVRQQVVSLLGAGEGDPAPEYKGRTSGRRGLLLKELTAVLDENERLHRELTRARELLRRHGIDPDEPDVPDLGLGDDDTASG
jgi:prophage maintenance system killer protein